MYTEKTFVESIVDIRSKFDLGWAEYVTFENFLWVLVVVFLLA